MTAPATELKDATGELPPAAPARVWRSIWLSMLVLAAVFACRGWVLAWMIGGSYAWSALVVDCTVLALVILALRLLDLGVKRGTAHLIGDRTRTRRVLAVLANWSLVFLLAAPFLMALVQFHPQKIGCSVTPADVGLPYSAVAVESEGLQLAGWHIPVEDVERPVLVICHGVGANKQNFLPVVQMLHELRYHAFIFDFRGHGDSDGRTITFGMKESQDVKAVFDAVRARHPTNRIHGLGYSMGGSALLKMAAEHGGFDRVVVDSTFARADHVALHSMLWMFGPAKVPVWTMGRGWGRVFTGVDVGDHNPEDYVSRSSLCPVLLIHGAADDMIPPTEAQRLQTAVGPQAQLWLVEGAGHLQAMGHPDYRGRLRRFLEE
jgi:pimeloyl-ACP methyl ester carboxylesterase